MGRKLNIKTSRWPYPVQWFSEMSDLAETLKSFQKDYSNTGIILSSTLEKIYGRLLDHYFNGLPRIVLPDGEKTKRLSVVEEISVRLTELKFNRNSLLIAFGGGVIGDITGFTASVYMRSIDFIQIPTTLLAMVDSSVGGKTGVNLKTGKNLVGAFYPPKAVLIYSGFLKTLPQREINGGLAEVVKSAVICKNKHFFQYIEENTASVIRKDIEVLEELSYRSIKMKAYVVQKDETEQGIRAFLNLGHTLAHGIESYLKYKKIIHGEAVSIGLHFAAYYSKEKHYLKDETYERIKRALIQLRLPYRMRDIPSDKKIKTKELVALMKKDKKVKKSRIRFVFLTDISKLLLPQEISENELASVIKKFKKEYGSTKKD